MPRHHHFPKIHCSNDDVILKVTTTITPSGHCPSMVFTMSSFSWRKGDFSFYADEKKTHKNQRDSEYNGTLTIQMHLEL